MPKSKKGILLPPAVGYSFRNWIKLLQTDKIKPKYYGKVVVISLVNLVNYPFRTYERLLINKRVHDAPLKNPPIFILGHWRSGTTHLHNILSQDQQMGYTTTYQSVFPDTLFNKIGRFLFRGFSKVLMPSKREGDNVTLSSELPQEEEFALADKTPLSFYFFWMFPKHILEFYHRYIRFEGISDELLRKWKLNYKLLIQKSLINTKKEVYLSKNPPNTGRIRTLLALFPEAKFIHIHRNPLEVFLSTRNFYDKMMPHLQLQDINTSELDGHIIKVYQLLMNDYLAQKDEIPKGNLVEIAFTDLEQRPVETLEELYSDLGIPNFQKAKDTLENYLETMKTYKKNTHQMSKKDFDKINKEWKFAFDYWNYKKSDTIEILS